MLSASTWDGLRSRLAASGGGAIVVPPRDPDTSSGGPVPIFELDAKSVLPFRQQAITAGVCEAEIEDLLWDNLEELTGDNLFRIALDADGRVVVIEVDATWTTISSRRPSEYGG